MRDKPHPSHKLEWPGGIVPEWARPQGGKKKRFGKNRGKSGANRERLQKVMAQSGYGSRRNIEILIAQGHITINGEVAKLGDSVGPGDKVKLDGKVIHLRFGEQLPRVLLYHKPEGEIVTRDDPEKRATVFDKLPKVTGGRWVSVGRLDINTSGLLMFTTSGELVNKLTHPRFEVEREYAVRVMGEIDEDKRKQLLETGVDIDGDSCTFDSIEDRGGEGSNHWYHVVLREGKNREVRRMMEAVGLMVSRLMRVRFGPVQLPGFLKRGMMREMDETQVQELLAFAGMNEPPPSDSDEEEEEHPDDNIGNRFDPVRDAKKEHVPDDDIGNRAHHHHAPREPREVDGNRGTYGEPHRPAKGPRRPHGQAQGQGPGHGQPKPFGMKKRGGQGHPAAGHGNQAKGQGQHQRRKGRGQGLPDNVGNVAPQAGPRPHGAPPPAGAAKPGRRRNKNRNRNRGAAEAPQPPRAVQAD